MKKIKTLFLTALVCVSLLSDAAIKIITGPITVNTTWTRGNTYILRGFVYVKNNAVLTIQSGTLIKGEKATKGSLIIERNSQLVAIGTVSQPIVFTSDQAVGQRASGDWGGIILLGNAPINPVGGTAVIEGGIPAAEGTYGGNNAADNSGTLKYVRIEFPGIAYQPNNEINGLTMGGVGSGTTIDYVQVSYSGDDSYEWFGGAVNTKHIIAYKGLDDDFDTDFGYSGKNQFVFGMRDPNIADVSTSHAFESDNDATGSANAPKTKAVFSNVTSIGPKQTLTSVSNSLFSDALHIRRNTEEKIYNSIFMGWPTGLHIDGTAATTEGNATNGLVQFQNNIIAGVPGLDYVVNSGSTFNIYSWKTAQGGNDSLQNCSDLLLSAAFNYANPKPTPLTGSLALTGAAFTNPNLTDPFFTATTYRGAFKSADTWMNCWSSFTPDTNTYTVGPISYPVPATTVTPSGPTTFCAGGSVTLCVTNVSGYTYQWYKGTAKMTGKTNACLTATAAGTYKCLMTTNRGCTKYSVVTTVTINCREAYDISNAPTVIAYPNPFSSVTNFKFNVYQNSKVEITVYDITGKLVATPVSDNFTEGDHTVSFDASDLSTGFYSAKVSVDGQMVQTIKLQIIKN